MTTKGEKEYIPHSATSADSLFEYAGTFPADLTQRRDYLSQFDVPDAIEMIQYINSMVCDEDGLAAFDRPAGDYVNDTYVLNEAVVPDVRDAECLLARAWEVSKGMLSDYTLPDEVALALAGITMANAVLLVHPFIDGNGRTSRVMSYIMVFEQPTAEDFEEIVSKHLGGRRWLIQPQFEQRTVSKTDSRQPGRIGRLWLVDDDDSIEYMLSNAGAAVTTGSIRSFIERHADDLDDHLVPATNEREMLDADKFVSSMMQHEDVAVAMFAGRAMLEGYREARAEVVESFLSDMRHSPSFRRRQLRALHHLSTALRHQR